MTLKVVTMIHNVLLLALVQAYGNKKNAFLMLEEIEKAMRYIEQEDPTLRGRSREATSALITLDGQKLIRIDRGRVYLTPDGIQACKGLELPSEWKKLPKQLAANVST